MPFVDLAAREDRDWLVMFASEAEAAEAMARANIIASQNKG